MLFYALGMLTLIIISAVAVSVTYAFPLTETSNDICCFVSLFTLLGAVVMIVALAKGWVV